MRRLITFVTPVRNSFAARTGRHPRRPGGQRPGRRDGSVGFSRTSPTGTRIRWQLNAGQPRPTQTAHQEGGAIAMHSLNRSSTRLSRNARLAVLSALVACGTLLAMVQPAAAQLVDRTHQHMVATIPNQAVCGVKPVTI